MLNMIENTLAMERVKICLHYGTRVWLWVWSLSLRQNHSSLDRDLAPVCIDVNLDQIIHNGHNPNFSLFHAFMQ